MKKVVSLLISAVFSFFCLSAEAVVPAFPGADGAGKYAKGGRGGNVVEVTNLDDSGTGSLRWALDNTANPPPKIIVFRVSGTIELQSTLNVAAPYITIAGQTAPGDGITLKNFPLNILSPETIVRFIRVRMGERKGTYGNRDNDCMHIEARGKNIIVDHCSFSWGIDETVSPQSLIPINEYLPNMDNLTVQWCILSNPLNKSVHTEGEHGKATLGYGCYKSRWSFHHNIYAHSMDRNPWIAGQKDYTIDPNGAWFDFRNNVVYNWGYSPPSFSRVANAVTQVNFISNYYKSGVNSESSTYAYQARDIHGKGYFSDNRMNGVAPANPWDLVEFVGFTPEQITAYKQSSPINVGEMSSTDSSLTAYAKVLADAGCTVPYRDSVDARVVHEIDTGTGEVIDCTTPGNFYYQVGTAIGGTANKIILPLSYPGRETGQDNYYVEITGGTGAGQTRFITFYHEPSYINDGDPNKWFRVTPDWDVIPDNTSTFGVIVDCTKNAGGWPVLTSTTPPTDTDHDGMPDAWEIAKGLDPSNPNDGKIIGPSGYSNVELYLNYLVDKKKVLPADFDNDGDVDEDDLDTFTMEWLVNDCYDVPRGNMDIDCDVDFKDYAIFADNWLDVYNY